MHFSKKSRWVPNYGDINNPDVRAKYGYLEASVSIAGNIFLFILKLSLGIFINSIALIADSVHSLSDVSTSGIVILGFRIAKKKPDKQHPFGHGRAEYIATLIIAVLLVVTGLGLIQRSIEGIMVVESLFHPEFSLIISIIVLISALSKEVMARYCHLIAKNVNSDVLVADSWHHRADALSSVGVAVSIIASSMGYPIFDPIFGIIVSGFIIYMGIFLIRRASDLLMGKAPDEDVIKKIKDISNSVKGVEGVHKITIHDYGTSKIITLHVEADNDLNIDDSHDIANSIQDKIRDELNYSTIIHIEPKNQCRDNAIGKHVIEEILDEQKSIISFNKIKIIKHTDKYDITIHVTVDKDMSVKDTHELCHSIEETLQDKYGPCTVIVHFEPCIKNCRKCEISCRKRKK